jgi:hypothetical protein
MARPRYGSPGATGQPGAPLPGLTAPAAPAQKKALHAAERDTERVQPRRAACRETVQSRDVHRWKLLDASGATLALSRR